MTLDLLHKMVDGDEAATLECLALTGTHKLESATPSCPSPLTTKYTLAQLDSAEANLEVFANTHQGIHD